MTDGLQERIGFNPDAWREYAGEWYPSTLDTLEPFGKPHLSSITRRDVFAVAADGTHESEVGLLVAVCAWGAGCRGRSVVRSSWVFTRNDLAEVERKLTTAREVLSTEGPVAAYRQLRYGNRLHIKYLGPSFFTKYLYFAAGAVLPVPLIYDGFVQTALSGRGVELNWSAGSYGAYLDYAAAEAGRRGAAPDVIEVELFEEGKLFREGKR